jgi:hypothetical protein
MTQQTLTAGIMYGTEYNKALAWYQEAFKDINKRAMMRHLMNSTEFKAMDEDSRVMKFLVYEDDEIVGGSALALTPTAWPLIAPEYFEYHYPEQYAADKIYYIGFVGANPRRVDVFNTLMEAMYPWVKDGLSFMDFCAFNVDKRYLPQRTGKFMRGINPSFKMKQEDTQLFFRYWFADTQPSIGVAA